MAAFRLFSFLCVMLCTATGMALLRQATAAEPPPASAPHISEAPDLSGEWEIQEEDKSYKATLDKKGNGPYTWQGGHITTLEISDRKWHGTWQQSDNDREGGFELLLAEDGMEAKGVWWYTRVAERKNIPARQWGGSYLWRRLSAGSAPSSPNP
jgi:hypothetical protein